MKNKKFLVDEENDFNITFTEKEEAEICLNCPLPNCNKRRVCRRFEEEIKKLRNKKNVDL